MNHHHFYPSQRLLGVASLCSLALALSAPAALAQVTVTATGGAFGENLLLASGQTEPIVGTVNGGNPDFFVNVTSTTDVLMSQASGQAFISSLDTEIENITITAMETNNFTTLIANARQGEGALAITVNSTFGTQTFSNVFNPLGNGSNFFTVEVTGGTITSVTLTAPGGFTDLRQIRVGGGTVETGGITDVAVAPEPGTVALVAMGLMGTAGMVIRRRKA